MADIFTKTKRSAVMSSIRSTGNKSTELKLAVAFRANRIVGWRRHLDLPGRPDFYFKEWRLAVFVDGCFWHGCKKCRDIPKSRKSFWTAKIKQNMARDKRSKVSLEKAGIAVLRIWEHQLKTPQSTLKVLENLKKRFATRENRLKITV